MPIVLTQLETEVQTRADALTGGSTIDEVIEAGIAAKKVEAAGGTIERTNLDAQINAKIAAMNGSTLIEDMIAMGAASESGASQGGSVGVQDLGLVSGNTNLDLSQADTFYAAMDGDAQFTVSGIAADTHRKASVYLKDPQTHAIGFADNINLPVGFTTFQNNPSLGTAQRLDPTLKGSLEIDGGVNNTPFGISGVSSSCFNNDGTKVYILCNSGNADSVAEMNLATPYDMNTMSWSGVEFSLSGETSGQTVWDVRFSTDGLNMYILRTSAPTTVFQYTLSVAWDLSTASYSGNSLAMTNDSNAQVMILSGDGTKIFVAGATTDAFHQYTMSTPWDVSTATDDTVSLSVANMATTLYAAEFSTDGSRLYILNSGHYISSFTLATPWDITTAADNEDIFYFGNEGTTAYNLMFSGSGDSMQVMLSSGVFWHYALTTPWDLGTGISVYSEDTNPWNILFNDTGSKMYVKGYTNNTVFQYTLSTPWDTTTATYDSVSFATTEAANGNDVKFGDNGSKLYAISSNLDAIYQYNLSTPWDLSTAAYASKSMSTSPATNPYSFEINPAGTRIFVSCTSTSKIYQFDLATPWDLATGTNSGKRITTGVGYTIHLNGDGTKMYAVNSNSYIYEIHLPTPYDLVDAYYNPAILGKIRSSYQGRSTFANGGNDLYLVTGNTGGVAGYSITRVTTPAAYTYPDQFLDDTVTQSYYRGQNQGHEHVFMNDAGTHLFVLQRNYEDSIFTFELATPFDLSTAVLRLDKQLRIPETDSEATLTNFIVSGDGQTVLIGVRATNEAKVYQYDLATPWDMSTGSYARMMPTRNRISALRGIEYSSDGTELVTMTTTGLFKFTLDTPWQLPATVDTLHGFNLYSGIVYSTDGYYCYYVQSNDYLAQTRLKTPFDASSKYDYTYASVGNIQDSAPKNFRFKPDGTRFFIVGSTNDLVYQWDLTTPWDLSTASYSGTSFNPSAQLGTGLVGIEMKPDGTRMYLTTSSPTGGQMFQYTLSTPWDLSTAGSPVASALNGSVSTSEGAITFTPDGSMFVGFNQTNNDIVTYALSTPWDVSTMAAGVAAFSAADRNHALGTQSFSIKGLSFKDSGSTLVLHSQNSPYYLLNFALTTPYDPSTVVIEGACTVGRTIGAFVSETLPEQFCFSSDGRYCYTWGTTLDYVMQQNMRSPYDIESLASDNHTRYRVDLTNFTQTNNKGMGFADSGDTFYISQDYTVSAYTVPKTGQLREVLCYYAPFVYDARGLSFSPDGLRLFVLDHTEVYQHDLAVPFDISTLEGLGQEVSFPGLTYGGGMKWAADGMSFYGTSVSTIYRYWVLTPYDITSYYGSFDQLNLDTLIAAEDWYKFVFNSSGTRLYVQRYEGAANDAIHQINLPVPWDITSAVNPSLSFETANINSAAEGEMLMSPDNRYLYFVSGTMGTSFSISTFRFAELDNISTMSNSTSYTYTSMEPTNANSVTGAYLTDDGKSLYVADHYKILRLALGDLQGGVQRVDIEQITPTDVQVTNVALLEYRD